MNNIELAKSNISQAKKRIYHASEALNRGNHPYVVRQCQEAVELALKASLRLIGIEPPKWFSEIIDKLASISRKLRKERVSNVW